MVLNKDSELREYWVYSADVAQDKSEALMMNKGPRSKLTTSLAKAICDKIIKEKSSPYRVSIELQKEGNFDWVPSPRSIYYAIDEGLIGITRNDLPYKPIGKKKHSRGRRMAYTNIKGRPISERPKEADERSEYGHWEVDTMPSGRGTSKECLLVFTERMTRKVVIIKISARTQKAVLAGFNKIECSDDNIFKLMKSLTSDNGSEFLDFESLQKSVLNKDKERCQMYYARPYCASNRGSNENAIKIVRRFVPKGFNIAKLTNKKIKEIQDWINSMPRKILEGLTAVEKLKLYLQENAA